MKAYLVNLDRSPDRLAAADAQLRAVGVAYERVPAVDGRALGAAERRRAANRLRFRLIYGAWPSAGTIGCALSHQAVYARMDAAGVPLALVFEDDVAIPDPGLFRETVEAVARMDDPAVPTAWRLERRPQDPPDGDGGFRPAVHGTCGMCAYAINLAGARLLMRLNGAPIVALADDWARFARLGLRALTACRAPCRESGAASTIGGASRRRPAWRVAAWRLLRALGRAVDACLIPLTGR